MAIVAGGMLLAGSLACGAGEAPDGGPAAVAGEPASEAPTPEAPASEAPTSEAPTSGAPPTEASPTEASPTEPAAAGDTAWRDGPWHREARAVDGQPTLVGVRVGAHEGYDRLVFEFDGGLPGYRVEPLAGPAHACGSGAEVPLEGPLLEVAFTSARAHTEAGRATVDLRLEPGLPAVERLRLTCDFEGHVNWVAALAGRAPTRVLELRAPPRIVVDVRHR